MGVVAGSWVVTAFLFSGQPAGGEAEGLGRDVHPVGAELVGPGDHRGALQEITGDLLGRTVLRLGQEAPGRPAVERPHGRATPDLVVGPPGGLAVDGPAAGHAQVPAE